MAAGNQQKQGWRTGQISMDWWWKEFAGGQGGKYYLWLTVDQAFLCVQLHQHSLLHRCCRLTHLVRLTVGLRFRVMVSAVLITGTSIAAGVSSPSVVGSGFLSVVRGEGWLGSGLGAVTGVWWVNISLPYIYSTHGRTNYPQFPCLISDKSNG